MVGLTRAINAGSTFCGAQVALTNPSEAGTLCGMTFKITAEDIQFSKRKSEDLLWSIEPATSCDGVTCTAGPHLFDPSFPHWHLVGSAPDLHRAGLVYIDPTPHDI